MHCVPPYVEKNKIHAGPFLWMARKDHYEYTHVDPDEGCLMILEGEKSVRLISNAFWKEMEPNPLGSMGRTVQSRKELLKLLLISVEKTTIEKWWNSISTKLEAASGFSIKCKIVLF